jgi:outer membrane protein OmpA-like peptidoglycan-associated protein
VVVRDPNEVLLFAQVVFRFDRVALADIAAGGLVSVQSLLQRVRDERLVLQSVQLSGHADRLNGTGRADYNQSLSEHRVASVRDFLVAQGIAPDRIRLDARGDRQPRATCEALAGAALQDCLLPDRRVEVLVTTRRP